MTITKREIITQEMDKTGSISRVINLIASKQFSKVDSADYKVYFEWKKLTGQSMKIV